MNILSLYKNYPITRLLQEHQLRAAAVGKFICDNWKSTITTDTVVTALLLHDMGNIIKYNLANPTFLSDDEKAHIDYWKQQQQEYTKKYGDEHRATSEIAKELMVSDDVYTVISNTGSSKLPETLVSNNWELKIVSYADLRCAPHSVVSLNDRFDDIIKRYQKSNHALANAEDVEKRRTNCVALEKQIQEMTTIDLDTITEEVIQENIQLLSGYFL